MRKYQPPTREFFRPPNKIFQIPLDATQFKLYAYLVCCSGSKGYCWPNMETIMRDTGIKKVFPSESHQGFETAEADCGV